MRAVIPALVLAAASPVAAMPVSEFLTRAEALERMGMGALFSKDLGRLKAELQTAGKAIRADQEAARAARRPPGTCMPKKAGIQSGELLAYLRTIPPPQRSMSVKDALAGLMRRKYPCPG